MHEDRGLEDCRQRSGSARGEVAGIEEVGNENFTVALVADSGGTGVNRRTRPLSLAVQPLNYHRLDPEITNNISNKHPNMTSQESIGSCSLDVDRSASDRSGWKCIFANILQRKKMPNRQNLEHNEEKVPRAN